MAKVESRGLDKLLEKLKDALKSSRGACGGISGSGPAELTFGHGGYNRRG